MPPACADAPPRAAGAGERRPDAVAEGSPRPRHADPEGCRGVLPPLAQSLSVIKPKRRVADRSGVGPCSPSPTCASVGGGPVLNEAAAWALAARTGRGRVRVADRDAAGAARNAHRQGVVRPLPPRRATLPPRRATLRARRLRLRRPPLPLLLGL